ncbi:hypothetical protein K504DRAFT_490501 [Pleomassaria siparia CBS 279.74]|uniref:Uncharacterized protein n=1 Tax=Pleomassaria siparia CBS 279.74 TaxID=1314801 RepID=A0A6G1KCK1_9PLEO|nr:hypothetical protein K504DRAFT_490501 [Pleomassaria siparia CBS 279.74]
MKSVLVVGAGPAGLVAAKTLLQHGNGKHFKVTVFEAADKVGGMWRADANEEGEKCSPNMRTNLSRFTVAFSDLSWNSVSLEDTEDKENTAAHTQAPPPMFPKAWQVGLYLQRYAHTYIPNGIILCNREVLKADIIESRPLRWSITSLDKVTNATHKNEFDQLIIASGFFSQPFNAIDAPERHDATSGTQVQHSAKFRDVSTFSHDGANIVVIGGGISGSEAAAAAAFQISNRKYAPGQKHGRNADSKVIHIVNRPFYCLPRYLPQDPYDPTKQDYRLAPSFLPLDLVLYNLSRRGEGDIYASNGKVPPEKAKKGHDFIRSCIGNDQRELGSSELVYRQEHVQYPSYTGISDMYSEFVRSGLIELKQGHATSIALGDSGTSLTIDVQAKSPWSTTSADARQPPIRDMAGVVEATGFRTNLEYLSETVKKDLQFDEECARLPLLLGKGSVFGGERYRREIAFVGFYEGPYWSVMEAQAQLVAATWSGVATGHSDLYSPSDQDALRKEIKTGNLDIPQFWMSDYVGLVEEISREAGLERVDLGFGGRSGPAFPARYAGSNCNKEQANKTIQEVQEVLRGSKDNARFVAAATFRAMQGSWTLERKIDSRHISMPGGTFKGTASFHPRSPTNSAYSAEYLYIEEGILKMDNGYTFPATRRYAYRYSEAIDTITAWFVADDGVSVGAFFNRWEFQKPTNDQCGWIARGNHWCSPDTYKNNCEFRFRGASLETFGITYEATGPKKDYTHESWYKRPSPAKIEGGT